MCEVLIPFASFSSTFTFSLPLRRSRSDLQQVLPKRNGDGFGAVGGCCCQHLLWNALYGGFLDNLQTRVVTLMIGTNNRQASAEDVAEGIRGAWRRSAGSSRRRSSCCIR